MQLRGYNTRLKKRFKHLELVKGEGYFYFVYDAGPYEYETHSVPVYRLNDLTEEQWDEVAANFVANVEAK